MEQLLGKYSLTDFLSAIGFCVGCAFVTYVIRMFGYFNVVGQELLGMYLDSDLIQGAILALPAVILLAGFVHFSASTLFPLFDLMAAPAGRFVDKLPSVIKPSSHAVVALVAVIAFFGFIIVRIFMPDDDQGLLLFFQILTAMVCSMYALDYFIDNRKISVIWTIALALNGYQSLFQAGRFEALNDIKHSKNRYAVHASDKSFVNVTLLRSTSKAVLLRVGNEVVMYDRSQIIRIERMPKSE